MFLLNIRILAQRDTQEIYEYYKDINTSLSQRFLDELYTQLDAIAENPKIFQLKYKSTRVRYLKKFPFGIHYRIIDLQTVEILSIIHTSRNPEMWKKRD